LQVKTKNKNPLINKLEATWCLLNIASGTTQQTMSIIEKEGHLHIINLLKSPKNEILELVFFSIEKCYLF